MAQPFDFSPLDLELIDELGTFASDPYGFVMWAFPWGEASTDLASFSGPNQWQTKLLRTIGEKMRAGELANAQEALLFATTSGHGVGKSALVGMLVWWAFSTRANTRGVVTANTENQLRTKTWVEISKWHRLFLAKHLFKCTATAIFSVDERLSREWRIDIVPWSERNTEAFAGLHNQGNRILLIFDEASAIPDVIWETSEGALTDKDTEILWLVFGNPTRNKGRFRECFHGGKFAHRWNQYKVDSRSVSFTDHTQIQKWIDDYGLDSDFIRVRVLGEFPVTDVASFISRDLAMAAVNRAVPSQSHMPIIIGVDVARYGKDFSVMVVRQGRDCSTHPPKFFAQSSVTQLARAAGALFNALSADAIMVDGGGVGGGVVDILLDLGFPVFDVQFGAKADGFHDGVKYVNKRTEIWGLLREALPTLSILDRPPGAPRGLVDELTEPTYILKGADAIALESKESMRLRGVDSPDYADGLALTYAFPVVKHHGLPERAPAPYNPYSMENIYEKR